MKISLVGKSHVIDNIWSFVFEPESVMEYDAGQYVRVKLDHPNPDDEGFKRFFTNSAAPHEGVLQIVTRLTGSTFKNALSKLKEGATDLELLEAHDGDFIWQDTDRPILLVAAGIGVTPYHSILKQRVHNGERIPATLLYNGRNRDLPWVDYFAELEASHPEFAVVYQIDERVTIETLRSRFPLLNESLVYLSGPEAMVEDVGEHLKQAGLPEDQLMQDWFPNYDESSY